MTRRRPACFKGFCIGIIAFLRERNPGALCLRENGKVNAWTCIAAFKTCSDCWRLLSWVQGTISVILGSVSPSLSEQMGLRAIENIEASYLYLRKARFYIRRLSEARLDKR